MSKEVMQNSKTKLWYIKTEYKGIKIRKEKKEWTRKKYADEALQIIKDKIDIDIKANIHKNSLAITFDEAFKEYIDFKRIGTTKTSTLDGNIRQYEKHMKSFWGDRHIDTICVQDIVKWQHIIFKKTYNKNGIEAEYSSSKIEDWQYLLNSILKFLVSQEYLEKNVMDRISIVKRDVIPAIEDLQDLDKYKYIEQDVFKRFIKEVKSKGFFIDYAFYLISYFTGCRPGEAIALNIEHYDRLNKKLYILQNYYDKNKEITTTKNRVTRVCYIPQVVADALNFLLDEYYPLNKTHPKKPLLGLIRRMAKSTLKNRMVSICKSLEIETIVPYDLRKTNVTNLLEAGMSPIDISKRTGHSVEILIKYYALVSKKQDDRNNSILDKIAEEVNDF